MNSQVAVHLVYAAATGYAFVDCGVYLPTSWAEDCDRRRMVGVAEDVEFARKPAPARQMITMRRREPARGDAE
jgi:SRSO17 transposase